MLREDVTHDDAKENSYARLASVMVIPLDPAANCPILTSCTVLQVATAKVLSPASASAFGMRCLQLTLLCASARCSWSEKTLTKLK